MDVRGIPPICCLLDHPLCFRPERELAGPETKDRLVPPEGMRPSRGVLDSARVDRAIADFRHALICGDDSRPAPELSTQEGAHRGQHRLTHFPVHLDGGFSRPQSTGASNGSPN